MPLWHVVWKWKLIENLSMLCHVMILLAVKVLMHLWLCLSWSLVLWIVIWIWVWVEMALAGNAAEHSSFCYWDFWYWTLSRTLTILSVWYGLKKMQNERKIVRRHRGMM
jgi:hypothetical protein